MKCPKCKGGSIAEMDCPECDGSGESDFDEGEPCEICDGRGNDHGKYECLDCGYEFNDFS